MFCYGRPLPGEGPRATPASQSLCWGAGVSSSLSSLPASADKGTEVGISGDLSCIQGLSSPKARLSSGKQGGGGQGVRTNLEQLPQVHFTPREKEDASQRPRCPPRPTPSTLSSLLALPGDHCGFHMCHALSHKHAFVCDEAAWMPLALFRAWQTPAHPLQVS